MRIWGRHMKSSCGALGGRQRLGAARRNRGGLACYFNGGRRSRTAVARLIQGTACDYDAWPLRAAVERAERAGAQPLRWNAWGQAQAPATGVAAIRAHRRISPAVVDTGLIRVFSSKIGDLPCAECRSAATRFGTRAGRGREIRRATLAVSCVLSMVICSATPSLARSGVPDGTEDRLVTGVVKLLSAPIDVSPSVLGALAAKHAEVLEPGDDFWRKTVGAILSRKKMQE